MKRSRCLCALCAFCVPLLLGIVLDIPAVERVQATSQVTAAGRESAPSDGCLTCHRGAKDPHPVQQSLSCVDCHGGTGTATTKREAHPAPVFAGVWKTAANPPSTFTLLNRERHEWIRFVNPSDLRVAPAVCGRCHESIVRTVQKGPMVNSAQVYSTALYNNASVPWKDAM